MNFNDYQNAASDTADYPGNFFSSGIPPGLYTVMGLNGEAGEVAEKVKKYWRDGGDFRETAIGVAKELGDCLWYLSETARQWGWTLEEVAEMNLAKLAKRKVDGKIHGSGDNR